jgi:hypothetical protein
VQIFGSEKGRDSEMKWKVNESFHYRKSFRFSIWPQRREKNDQEGMKIGDKKGLECVEPCFFRWSLPGSPQRALPQPIGLYKSWRFLWDRLASSSFPISSPVAFLLSFAL